MHTRTHTDEYHYRRWQEEVERARAAVDRKVAQAHYELARLYSERLGLEPPPRSQAT